VAAYRELIVGRMDEMEDYLNWYEATQISEQSGAFAGFMQAVKPVEAAPRRPDAISKYMDLLEREFEP